MSAIEATEFARGLEEEHLLHSVWIELSRPNIISNWEGIRNTVGPNITVIPMLKANAYGHGAAEVGQVLQEKGAQYIGVSSLREAVDLRAHSITTPLLVTDYVLPDELQYAFDPRINATLTISHPDMLPPIQQVAKALGIKAKVHIFVNTGMNREGVFPQEAVHLVHQMYQSSDVDLEGIMTHLAEPTNTAKENPIGEQLLVLNQTLDAIETLGIPLPQYIHAAEGASVMRFPQTYTGRFTAVRPGNILYGIIPGDNSFLQFLEFTPRPILSIKARLAGLRTLPAGAEVGYGRTRIAKETRSGNVNIGHADGFKPSQSKEPVYMLVGGKRVRVLDHEAMNQLVLELPDEGNFAIGDEVVIIGKQRSEEITLAEAALKMMGTTNLTRFTAQLNAMRLPRIVVDR